MQHGWNLCTSDRVLCLKVLCGMSTDVRTGIPGIWELVTACSLTLMSSDNQSDHFQWFVVGCCCFLQHLEDYQRRLDLSYLKQSEDPMMDEFRVSGSTEAIAPCVLIAAPLLCLWLFLSHLQMCNLGDKPLVLLTS